MNVSRYASIINGESNVVGCRSMFSTILNGYCNTIPFFDNSCGGPTTEVANSGALIGGGSYNCIEGCDSGVFYLQSGSAILQGRRNLIYKGNGAIIGIGRLNTISGSCVISYSSILNGNLNTISGNSAFSYSSILNGDSNLVSGNYSTILNGLRNSTTTQHSSILGGCDNINSGTLSTIVGGTANEILSSTSIIGGGSRNMIFSTAAGHIINGGCCNTIDSTSGCFNMIGGGICNIISGTSFSTILGRNNLIFSGQDMTAMGVVNTILTSNNATIAGGCNNVISGTSSSSGILGGISNRITGNTNTFIVGSCITANRTCSTFVNNLSIMNIPSSSAGLPVGSVWSDGGTLKIVV